MKNIFFNIITGLAVVGMVTAGCNSNNRTPADSDVSGQTDTMDTSTHGTLDTSGIYQTDNSGTGRTGPGSETGTGTGR